jgi:ribA/ribD-fused uncharacterized protein
MTHITINSILNIPVVDPQTHALDKQLRLTRPQSKMQRVFGMIIHLISFHYHSRNPAFDRTLHKVQKVAQQELSRNQEADFREKLVNSLKRLQPLADHYGTGHESKELGKLIQNLETTAPVQAVGFKGHDFIRFYDNSDPTTSYLGNFYPCSVTSNGIEYQCSEAAYQAQKFQGQPHIQRQFSNLDGVASWKTAKQFKTPQNWQQHSVEAMRNILNAKFSQNPSLKNKLLQTGSAYLVEHIPVKGRDAFWGDDNDGSGKNQLGILLMELRGQLGGVGIIKAPENGKPFLASNRRASTAHKVTNCLAVINPVMSNKMDINMTSVLGAMQGLLNLKISQRTNVCWIAQFSKFAALSRFWILLLAKNKRCFAHTNDFL